MSKMRLARPSSAVSRPMSADVRMQSPASRPMSADVHMQSGASRVTAPFSVYNPKGSSRLPARPHSSCEPGRDRQAWANTDAHYDVLSRPGSSDDIENIFDTVSTKAPVRTVKRRYLCSSTVLVDAANPEFQTTVPGPTMSHFDVKVKTDETSVDHLRMYYCDFFNPAYPDPPLLKDERTVEVERMCNWLIDVAPRTRFDAYPLWIITKDMLRRFLSRDICLIDKEAKTRDLRLKELTNALAKQEQEMKNSESALVAAQAAAAEAADLSNEVEAWKSKAGTFESECQRLQVQLDNITKQMENQEMLFAKRMDAKVLDVKAKVESIWEKQIESMRAQAEKARMDAEVERARFLDCQQQLQAQEKELTEIKVHMEHKVERHGDVGGRVNLHLLPPEEAEKLRASLPALSGEDLVSLLKELLTNDSLVVHLCSGAMEENRSEVESVLRDGQEDGLPAQYLDEHLSHSRQWNLLKTLISQVLQSPNFDSISSENKDGLTRSASSVNGRLPLLPILLHLALKPISGHEDLEVLLPSISDEGHTVMLIRRVSDAADEGLRPEEFATRIGSSGERTKNEVNQILNQLELKRAENAKLRIEIDGLLKQLDQIRENGDLGEGKGQLATSTSSLRRADSKLTSLKSQSSKLALIPGSQEVAPNIVNFRPLCLRVYTIDDRLLKGKSAKPMPVAILMNLVATAYEAKARADSIDDRKGNKRQHFPDFLRDFFLNKYGVRSLSFLNFKSFILGIQQNLSFSPERFVENLRKQPKISEAIDLGELQLRLRIFGIVSGIHPAEYWSDRLADFLLAALGKLFLADNLKESLEPKDQRGKLCVDLILALEATKDAWGKHGFDAASGSALENKILLLAQKESGNLLLYEWLNCLVQEWLASSGKLDAQLRHLFAIHDADGNGTMDLEEFNSVLVDTTPVLDESDSLRLFAEALLETGAMGESAQSANADPDSIHPQAFSYVARRFKLFPREIPPEPQ